MADGQNNKYILLSLQQRIDIVRKLEDGVPMSQLVKEYGVSSITIRRIKNNAVLLRQRFKTPGAEGRKKMRKPVLDELDNRLYAWFRKQRVIGDRITDAVLQEKAKELNETFGGPSSFSASKGWIWRFKNRHGINLLKPQGDTANADTWTTAEFTHSFLERLEEERIKLQNVYNMAETGLVWKALPKRTLVDTLGRRVYGNKIKKDRVTVGLCANATGTHKLPPLFIHRHEKPRALKHCQNRLPVIFKDQKKACMDQNIFADWLKNHFKPAVRTHQHETNTHGKVLLLIDNCAAHKLPLQLQIEDDNIEIVFFPSNATLNLQPMDQGVLRKVKKSFRHRVLKRILHFPGGVAEFCADYDIKDCMDLVNEAWIDVSSVDICNSWKELLGVEATEGKNKAGEGQPEASFCDMSNITSIKETVGRIARETVSQKEVEEWLLVCEEIECDLDDLEDEEECPYRRTPLNQDEDEIERMIISLVLWSENQSDIIKLHARVLKDYYDLVQK